MLTLLTPVAYREGKSGCLTKKRRRRRRRKMRTMFQRAPKCLTVTVLQVPSTTSSMANGVPRVLRRGSRSGLPVDPTRARMKGGDRHLAAALARCFPWPP
jgi:hypothetical protein